MPIERETVVKRPVASETVIRESGSPIAVIGAIVVAVLAVIMIIWLVNGGITSNGDAVNVDLPEVTVSP